MDDADLRRLAARGALAGAITAELAAPLAHAAKVLGELVDRLDRHVAGSRGPEPLPYRAVGDLRETLADLFLDVGRVRRLAADLALLGDEQRERRAEAVDVNELVERALSLSRHRLTDDQEVLLDLGTLPRVEVDAARLVQAMAHLLVEIAGTVGPGATLTVRTAAGDDASSVILLIGFPGRPHTSTFSSFIAEELQAEGRGFTYIEDGAGTSARLTLCVAK